MGYKLCPEVSKSTSCVFHLHYWEGTVNICTTIVPHMGHSKYWNTWPILSFSLWGTSCLRRIHTSLILAWTGKWNLICLAWRQTHPPIHHTISIFLFPSSLFYVNLARARRIKKILWILIHSWFWNISSNQVMQSTSQTKIKTTQSLLCLVSWCLFKSLGLECTWQQNSKNKGPLICCWEAAHSSLLMADFSASQSALEPQVVVGGRCVYASGIGKEDGRGEVSLSINPIGMFIILKGHIRKPKGPQWKTFNILNLCDTKTGAPTHKKGAELGLFIPK